MHLSLSEFGLRSQGQQRVVIVFESLPAALENFDFVSVGEGCGAGPRGGNGVGVPLCQSVRVEFNLGRGATLSLLVVGVRVVCWVLPVIAPSGAVVVVGVPAKMVRSITGRSPGHRRAFPFGTYDKIWS